MPYVSLGLAIAWASLLNSRLERLISRHADIKSHWRWISATSLLFVLTGCGGGDGATSITISTTTKPPAPDFSIAASVSTLYLAQGSSATLSFAVTDINSFNSAVTVALSGLPSGVSVSPAPLVLGTTTSQSVTLTASANSATGAFNISATGTSGSLSHSTAFTLQIATPALGAHSPFRMQYAYSDLVPPALIVPPLFYHQPTRRIFLADQPQNRIVVYDATTESQIATIAVPSASAIDETPDHSTLYVGTAVGDVYEIDPVSMSITAHVPYTQIGPNGYQASAVHPLADGRLALMAVETGGYIIPSFAIWDQSTNALTVYPGQIQYLIVTPDRTHLFTASVDGVEICQFDPATGQCAQIAPQGGTGLLIPADGQEFFTYAGDTAIYVYNMQTMQLQDQFQVAQLSSPQPQYILSHDGNTLYAVENNVALAYNWRTHTQIGWFPVPEVGTVPITPRAVDETGLIAGTVAQGVGFADSSALQTSAAPSADDGCTFEVEPNVGAMGGGTSLTVLTNASLDIANLYFGAQPLAGIIGDLSSSFPVTAPPHVPGPVDVTLQCANGLMSANFLAFSYGPSIHSNLETLATADGGGTETVTGYGLVPFSAGTFDVSALQVSSHGQALATGTYNNVYGYLPYAGMPSTVQYLNVTLPAGTVGSSADLTVSNQYGVSVQQNAVTYLPAAQKFPSPGANMAQGVYDRQRDLYYFTDLTRIQRFSRTQGQWLTPIAIPKPSGAASQALFGIGISPDSSKLAISDSAADVIYVLNIDSPTVVSTFSVPNTGIAAGVEPCGIVITDQGMVYFAAFDGGFGGQAFFSLDTSTGTFSPEQTFGLQTSAADDQYQRLELSSDGSHIYYAVPTPDGGIAYLIQPSGNTVTKQPLLVGDYDVALSENQSTVTASEGLYDYALDLHTYLSEPSDLEASGGLPYVYGEKLSPDGSLLFRPLNDGVIIIDTSSGQWLSRLALPFTLCANYDALVGDGNDNFLVAITGSGDGIAVLDLSSIVAPTSQIREVLARDRNFSHQTSPSSPAPTIEVLAVRSNVRSFKSPYIILDPRPRAAAAFHPINVLGGHAQSRP